MPYIADRVQDTTTTTGTGAVTLAGSAPTGYRTFAAAFGSAALRITYCIELNGEWEVGKGTFDGNVTLTRDVVRASSNSNALVNFSAGTKNVFCTANAELIDGALQGNLLAYTRGWPLP